MFEPSGKHGEAQRWVTSTYTHASLIWNHHIFLIKRKNGHFFHIELKLKGVAIMRGEAAIPRFSGID